MMSVSPTHLILLFYCVRKNIDTKFIWSLRKISSQSDFGEDILLH